jgi:hypothetical protein
MDRETLMKADDNKTISLYRRMLDIAEKEREEIAAHNLDGIESCWLQKKDLIRELEELSKGESWISCSRQKIEIESLIKKVAAINKDNAEVVRDMRNKVLEEMSGQKTRKKAFRAYNTF